MHRPMQCRPHANAYGWAVMSEVYHGRQGPVTIYGERGGHGAARGACRTGVGKRQTAHAPPRWGGLPERSERSKRGSRT